MKKMAMRMKVRKREATRDVPWKSPSQVLITPTTA